MPCAEIYSLNRNTSCSGKCQKTACTTEAATWVAAACEGMVALYRKGSEPSLTLEPQSESEPASSLELFCRTLATLEQQQRIGQLILIGGGNDLAWMHRVLSEKTGKYITAEIEYPLLPAWFRAPETGELPAALSRLVK